MMVTNTKAGPLWAGARHAGQQLERWRRQLEQQRRQQQQQELERLTEGNRER